jgi:glycosyltransferase involved in cell wall biosynthesis
LVGPEIVTAPKIVYLPDYAITNVYVLRMQEILASFGDLEKLRTRSRLLDLLRGRWQRVDLIVVNWEENALISRRTRGVSAAGLIQLFLKAVAMRVFARRMVFVRHNHYPHGTRPKSAAFVRWLIDRYEALFDYVFVHSGADLAQRSGRLKRHYLPHPLYRPVSRSMPAERPATPPRYFLMFGRIVPYKNLDKLMTAFPSSANLLVYGEVGNRQYATVLGRIKRPNVFYQPGYVSEAVAQMLVTGAQAVVIANENASTIVSGTFFYSLSLQRPVLAVRTPFLDWMAPRLGPGVLTLADDVEHLCELVETSECVPWTEETRRIVQRELGDEAVRSALEVAFASM